MVATAKETIYIEADDEITAVIDKVVSSKEKITAVVLPKRATVFQSVVNMKLLKKAASEAKKQVVVISSEPAIESIAAVAGVHLAKSLNSKPAIPKRIKQDASEVISSKELESAVPAELTEPEKTEEKVFEEPLEVNSKEDDADSDSDSDDTIELDNTDDDAVEVPAGTLAKEPKKKKKNPFKIPDFSSFKLRMGLGIVAVLLVVVGWFFGFVVLPKATVTLNTDTSSSTVTFDFIANTDAKELDLENATIPAKKVEVSKESSATVPATGEKNVGEKATGSVTMSAQICGTPGFPDNVPAGTGVSSNGKTFITQEDASFSFSSIGGGCINFNGDTVSISAQSSGSSFNLSSNSEFTVAGRAEVSASGSATGGTDTIVKVVSADDINKAKEQLSGSSTAEAISELTKNLEAQELQALKETISEGQPTEKISAAVDSEVSEVTVTQTVLFSMLGVSSNDLVTLLDDRITATLEGSIDKNIRRNGLDAAAIRRTAETSPDNQTLSLQTVAVIGPEFDEEAIKNEVIGKKRGDIEKLLEARDGVRSVSVDYSPIWITTTPKSADKITIVVNELEN